MANARIKIFQILQFFFVARGLTPFLIYFRKNSATCQARGCKPWFSLCFEFTYFYCLRNWWNRFIEACYPFFCIRYSFLKQQKNICKAKRPAKLSRAKIKMVHPSKSQVFECAVLLWMKRWIQLNVMSVQNKNNIYLNY